MSQESSSKNILVRKGGAEVSGKDIRGKSPISRLVEFYDSFAQLYDRFFTEYSPFYREHYLSLKSVIDSVLRYIPRGSLVADLGCGTGFWSSYLESKGYSVVGVDLSSRSVYVLRSRGLDGLVSDARLAPFRRHVFDLVVSLGSVINHIEELGLFLKSVNRILKKGGYLIFDFDNASSLDNLYESLAFNNSSREYLLSLISGFRKGYRFYWDLGGYYIRVYSLQEVLRESRESGFKVINIKPIHTFTAFIPSRISERGGKIVTKVFDALHRLENIGSILPFSYVLSVSTAIILRKI
ncbi:MAG: methyltransferase domain-containing protein [Desulfurococcales archaeon]|nr:methyltransferase domain-containing protein [Desulfurococcales archaeon]